VAVRYLCSQVLMVVLNYKIYLIFFIILFNEILTQKLTNGSLLFWGLGIGDWGLGIGDWAQSPIPNPQSPLSIIYLYIQHKFKIFLNINFVNNLPKFGF
jgi:hypothetical protein